MSLQEMTESVKKLEEEREQSPSMEDEGVADSETVAADREEEEMPTEVADIRGMN